MRVIKYKSGYKYQLADTYEVKTSVFPNKDIETYYLSLKRDGWLKVRHGYAWDGPSGPTFDSKNFMRGSLVHDALYQLMREGHLDPSWKANADADLRRMCREDGMTWIRAWWVHRAVKRFAGFACDPKNIREICTAP